MAIDNQSHYYQLQRETQQNYNIVRWCLKRGIPVDIVEGHPCFQDILFLLDFRYEFQAEYKTHKSMLATYNRYWQNVYSLKRPLKPKAWRQFEIMATECLRIRQQQEIKKQVIRQLRKLQSTGTRHNENKDHDMTAKGSNLPAKVSIREQQGGREELRSSPPWE